MDGRDVELIGGKEGEEERKFIIMSHRQGLLSGTRGQWSKRENVWVSSHSHRKPVVASASHVGTH